MRCTVLTGSLESPRHWLLPGLHLSGKRQAGRRSRRPSGALQPASGLVRYSSQYRRRTLPHSGACKRALDVMEGTGTHRRQVLTKQQRRGGWLRVIATQNNTKGEETPTHVLNFNAPSGMRKLTPPTWTPCPLKKMRTVPSGSRLSTNRENAVLNCSGSGSSSRVTA
jgi:hypothetical protein